MDLCSVPKKTLLEQMAVTPRYRLNGLPKDTRNIVLFAEKSFALKACQSILDYSEEINICAVFIHKYTEKEFCFQYNGKEFCLPVIDYMDIKNYPHCLAVLFWDTCIAPDLLYHQERVIQETLNTVIFPRVPFGTGRKHAPFLYREYGKELEKIYANLADEESKCTFASVVKGLSLGEIDWIRPCPYPEYQHSLVCAEEGDIVIDAGLFDSTVIRKFAQKIGKSGRVYGFEPEPNNYRFVGETIVRFGNPEKNIVLVNKGVYSHKDVLFISDEGASGKLNSEEEKGSKCEVIDIDSFVLENVLEKVDLIKMDIEGAEFDALRGAQETIKKYKPKLQICAYHKINDLIELYNFIYSLNNEYKFYFISHAPYLNEYVYYVI